MGQLTLELWPLKFVKNAIIHLKNTLESSVFSNRNQELLYMATRSDLSQE